MKHDDRGKAPSSSLSAPHLSALDPCGIVLTSGRS